MGREESGHNGGKRPFIQRRAVLHMAAPLVRAALLLLIAGRLNWGWGWLYLALYIGGNGAVLLLVRDEALLAERERQAADAKAWDVRLMKVYGATQPLLIVVAALDAGRFGWSPPLPVWLHALGGVALLLGFMLAIWPMRVNTFFAGYVRIQQERNHRVVTDGPYRWVRHPAYLGMLLGNVGTPLLLGSLWALLPALAATALILVRTAKEDRTLQGELTGYAAYAARVRYKLLPGIW